MILKPSLHEPAARYVPAGTLTGQWEEVPERPSLPQPGPLEAARPLRICIATNDLAGPIQCGGVGTVYTTLARSLAEAGHDVTILYISRRAETHTIEHWISHYRQMGIRLVPLPKRDLNLDSLCTWRVRVSYDAYRWLREKEFDLIHFHEWIAPGYWCLVAKHQGLAFQDTLLCVGAHGPSLWSRMGGVGYVDSVDELEVDFMERRSVALADVVWAPSQYLIRWMLAHGWELPEKCYVQPYIMPHAARIPRGSLQPEKSVPEPVREIVFFGGLETRKGLLVFCDALDLLVRQGCKDFTVTFLGPLRMVNGRKASTFLDERAKRWPFQWHVLSDRTHPEAVEYLQQGGCLAVMPSLTETFGLTVLEAIGLGIPFLASRAGGIPEVVTEEDRDEVLFRPEGPCLAERLAEALEDGVRPARAAVDPELNEQAWLRWHAGLRRVDWAASHAEPEPPPDPAPLVSICMPTFNRPRLLRQALDSIQALDYPNFEVVLVDDASTDAEAVALLDELSGTFEERGWQLIRHEENRFAAGARNTAAHRARGEYLLFMDDHNYAKPHELDVFVKVAQKTGADILTSFRQNFTGRYPPDAEDRKLRYRLFLGPAAVPGLFRNIYGDMNALVRRDVYLDLGGQEEDYGVGAQDWEFFAKAVLAGCSLEVVPESLFFYRIMAEGIRRTTPNATKLLRVARPYRHAVPAALQSLILLSQGVVLHGRSREKPFDYRRLPGLHLIRVGLGNCAQEGPRAVLEHIWSKVRPRLPLPLRRMLRRLLP